MAKFNEGDWVRIKCTHMPPYYDQRIEEFGFLGCHTYQIKKTVLSNLTEFDRCPRVRMHEERKWKYFINHYYFLYEDLERINEPKGQLNLFED